MLGWRLHLHPFHSILIYFNRKNINNARLGLHKKLGKEKGTAKEKDTNIRGGWARVGDITKFELYLC